MSQPTRTRRTNILLLLADQQRPDTMGCYGQRLPITPHLDRLAAEGVRFDHAYTPQPVCGPARSCLQSGLYATRTGCYTNGKMLPLDQPTMAKQLDAAGYETAYVGKWHLATDAEKDGKGSGRRFIHEGVPIERRGGYQTYWMASDVLEFTSSGYEGYFFDGDNRRVDWEGYRVDKTTDFALDYLRDYHSRDGVSTQERPPFFMMVSYIEPHHQNDLDRYIGPIGSKQKFADFDAPGDLAADHSGDWTWNYPDYLGCCWSLDQNVGRLREALELYGLLDDTIIVYTADHACHFRTRNGEYKRSCHDSSIHVPLIVRGPGFTGGGEVEELVSLLDLPATVLDEAGADPLPKMDGRPLGPLVREDVAEKGGWRDEVYVQISETQTGRAIRTSRWMYSVIDEAETKPGEWGIRPATSVRWVEAFLYDSEADPHQLHNLIRDAEHEDIRDELRKRMAVRMVEAGDPGPTILPAPAEAEFAAATSKSPGGR